VRSRLEGTPFFREVNGRYTCDFALTPEALSLLDEAAAAKGGSNTSSASAAAAVSLGPEHVKLIELNCFYEATGMGLFDYHADKERLTDGPFEWRVRPGPMPQVAVKLESEWRGMLKMPPERRRVTDEARAALADALSQTDKAPAADASASKALTKQRASNATSLPPLALASLPVDVEEASIVIAHFDGDSALVGRAGSTEPSIAELALTGTWRDEENLRRLFASAELEPQRCVLFLVVADYRPACEGAYATLALFESLQLAGLYYDDPARCAMYCPPGVPAALAPWHGAEAISALGDFLEQAVVWRAMYEDYGPDIMKRVGGCRGGRYQELIPLRQPDGSLRNPEPGWRRVGGY